MVKRFVDVHERPLLREPEIELVVLTQLEELVVAAGREGVVATVHNRAVNEPVLREQVLPGDRFEDAAASTHSSVFLQQARAGPDHCDLWIGVEAGDLPCEPFRVRVIVGVLNGNVPSRRTLQPGVEGFDQAKSSGRRIGMDTFVADGGYDIEGIVRRAAVENQDFEVWEGLVEDGPKRPLDVGFRIVRP